jgi:hypothetical protein
MSLNSDILRSIAHIIDKVDGASGHHGINMAGTVVLTGADDDEVYGTLKLNGDDESTFTVADPPPSF